ncbi:MAG: efflux RND transporter permease subunit [Campylobacterales bacterium]|nr:efflux RND transporter permease subunit [Campylobacterales bacterium]
MFEKFVRFFIENSRLNYTLFALICVVGIWSYTKTPKEIFPSFELDVVRISGSYSGTSIDILDNIVVREIEDEVKSIEGVKEMTTVVSPGRFSIILELQKGTDKYHTSDKVKDAIDAVKSNFPSDMDDPRVSIAATNQRVARVSLSSETLSRGDIIEAAKDIKSKLLTIPDISDISIYGDSDLYFNVRLNESKIHSYGLTKEGVITALSNISYIFPIGKIEDPSKHAFISTYNGQKTAELMEKTLMSIGEKRLFLSDIAYVERRHEDASTLASFNGNTSITLSLDQLDTGDALQIVAELKKRLAVLKNAHKDLIFTLHDDRSDRVRDRLNIVISNIILAILLVGGMIALLINRRVALIVTIGIPTSFVMAAVYFYLFGFTINMISLTGVLIALGIVVDDAIVVAEAIQQRIEAGVPPRIAAVEGVKEVATPIFFASLTTLFAFIPALMISGTLGMTIKLIPIALSALLVASLVESYLFLPIHAADALSPNAKVLSWEKANRVYQGLIHFVMRWRKSFIGLFFVVVPVLIYLQIADAKFQMFPRFDASTTAINIKANVNTKIEDSFAMVQEIERDLMKKKEDFHISSISSVAGYRLDADRNRENYPYVMSMTIELDKLKPMNVIDKYITPYLSFYYDPEGRTRDLSSGKISQQIRKFIEQQNYKERFNLEEIAVAESRVGPIRSDVKIGIISNNNALVIEAIDTLKKAILEVGGVTDLADSISLGADEIKLKVTPYGEQVGVTEGLIGKTLSNLYLSRKIATALDDDHLLEIKIESATKDDFSLLEMTNITLPDGRTVRLRDVVEFQVIKSFEKVLKDFGERTFFVYATLDRGQILATEMLARIKPVTDKLAQTEGVTLRFFGEKQRNDELRQDMTAATLLALTLIMLSMLFMFNSFKDTFIVMSVIPFSLLGVLGGHTIMGMTLSMTSLIGALGLAGVVINNGIIMMTYIRQSRNMEELFAQATKRLRPIVLTSLTTLIGLASLIFFPTGQAVIFQPLAVALGFGLAWGTVLNLLYVPALYALFHRRRFASYTGEEIHQSKENL